MPWTYSQSSGQLSLNGVPEATGYSGAGTTMQAGRNNPSMQDRVGQGPIPVGQYRIEPAYRHPRKGANTMNPSPTGHNAHGRTGFMIHANNAQNNASQGCIIPGPDARQRIADSGDSLSIIVP